MIWWVALGLLGLFAVSALAGPSVRGPSVRSRPVTDADVEPTVARALVFEADPAVLRSFASVLDAAGRPDSADLLRRRAAFLEFVPAVSQKAQAPVSPQFPPMTPAAVSKAAKAFFP